MEENTKILCNRKDLTTIADAIRNKTGTNTEMTLGQMSYAIRNIQTGGGATPDWNATAEQDGHILNRTHYEEPPVTTTWTTLEETELEFDEYGVAYLGSDINLADGAECTVTWDGVEYKATCQYVQAYGVEALVMGNPVLIGVEENPEDNGQPFAIGYILTYNSAEVYSFDTAPTTHTIKIVSTLTTQEIHKLDNKFIDAEWMAKPPVGYNSTTILEEVTIVTDPSEDEENQVYVGYTEEFDTVKIIPNNIYYVTVDGTEYSTQCISAAGLGDPTINILGDFNLIFGILDAIKDPYAIITNGQWISAIFTTPGEHTISISQKTPIYEQLPTHYIEKDLAKVNADKYFNVNSGVLVWDGNTEGRFGVDGLWKISDDTPTFEDLQRGFTVTVNFGDSSETFTISPEEVAECVYDQGVIINVAEFAIILLSPIDGLEAGTYLFGYDEGNGFTYTSSLAINGYKFNDGSSKVINTEYLPEALRFGEGSEETKT